MLFILVLGVDLNLDCSSLVHPHMQDCPSIHQLQMLGLLPLYTPSHVHPKIPCAKQFVGKLSTTEGQIPQKHTPGILLYLVLQIMFISAMRVVNTHNWKSQPCIPFMVSNSNHMVKSKNLTKSSRHPSNLNSVRNHFIHSFISLRTKS